MNEERVRMNWHHSSFTSDKFEKIALSQHIYTDHFDMADVD